MGAISLLGGALTGLGIVLAIAGFRRVPRRSRGSALQRSWGLHRSVFPVVLCLAAGAVALIITGWPAVAIWVALVAAFVPRMFERRSATARIERIEALASWAEMIRDTTSAARGVQGAIVRSGSIAPQSIRPFTMALALNMKTRSLPDALAAFADDIDDPMADLIAVAIAKASTSSSDGTLGAILSALALNLRQHAATRMRVEVNRSRIRTSARSIMAVTGFVVAAFLIFDREFLHPYDSSLGQLVLFTIGGFFAGSFWLLERMGTMETPPRLQMPLHRAQESIRWQ